MSSPPALAFAHPSDRATALAGDAPPDRISMTEHLRDVGIGAFQAERGVTQTVRFDVVVEVANRAETAADDVDRILSYDTIVDAIDAALADERVNLLETLAGRIADHILAHPLARRVHVRIGKLDRGPYVLGVEIVRDAPEGRRRLSLLAADAPRPAVVFLGRAAVARGDLSELLDRLQGAGAPLILCVDRPATPLPGAGQAMPRRRIELLAIEQQAWVLASRDRRCVVVDSRTELDWALRQGRISVWAPSKLVLDAVDGPGPEVTDPLDLCLWLAEGFDAAEILVFDDTRAVPTTGRAARVFPPTAMPWARAAG